MVGLKPPEVPPTAAMKFVSAGMAGCIADLCTFPLDTAKVRLQIQGEVRIPRTTSSVEYRGVLGTLSTMVRTEGARSLYSGLAAGLQRQMSFASIRIGLYDSVKQLYTPKGAENTGVATRLLAGCTTGAVAVACAQPTDVVKVRFQASGALSDSARRYSGTVDAYLTIAREEGVRGLWRASNPRLFSTFRQRPVPLCGCLWRRVLCHSGGITSGRGEDAVHECQLWAVPQRPELPPGPAHAGWPRRPLQGLHPVLPAAGLLERGDVCVVRAAAAHHGAGTAGPGLSPSACLAGSARLSINYINCRSAREQRSHTLGEGAERLKEKGCCLRRNLGEQRRVLGGEGKKCLLASQP
ncbi:putative mitochondrial transporter UCP3 isoform X4 [Taeniopygia guttata]